ncbi:hypothetical protein [Haloechinothrix sp. LS1_15]|uniref:hypothetical protein n=1 Tax=Haloechinothrix sp. LS1_15 TaxID=2652248 RepID=UPI0029484D4B|nr:hypothetical protein [Haloechinothrix sp. LS1_15]MDV6012112.1 hypothetical protein [Haloechinothrix sp. LS1_15]
MTDPQPHQWYTAGQQRHLLARVEYKHGLPVVITACGWRIRPSPCDVRLVDPPVCLACDGISHTPATR